MKRILKLCCKVAVLFTIILLTGCEAQEDIVGNNNEPKISKSYLTKLDLLKNPPNDK